MKVEFLKALLQMLPLDISGFGESAVCKLQRAVLGADVKYQVKEKSLLVVVSTLLARSRQQQSNLKLQELICLRRPLR